MLTPLLLATTLSGATGAYEDLGVARLAPENTFFYAEVSDLPAVVKRWAATGVGKLLMDGKSVDEALEPIRSQVADELDIDLDDVKLPSDAGFVAYTVLDEELGVDMPAWMAYVSWKDDEAMAKAAFDEQLEELDLEYEQERLRGRDLYIIETEVELPDLDEVMMDAMPMPMMMGDSSMMDDAFRKVFVVRDGSLIVASSEPLAIDRAFKVIDGGSAKTLADSESFQTMEDMTSGTPDLQVGLLTEPLGAFIKPIAGPTFAAGMPFIRAIFGDITGWGFYGTVGRDGNVLASGQNISFNGGPQGIMKLLDVATPVGAIPGYIPEEAMSYGRMNFDFKNLVPTINEIIAGLPEAEAEQLQQATQMFGPMLQTATETLGPAMHIFTTEGDDEFSMTRVTVAIPSSDTKKLDQVVSMFGPMGGFQPRDFNGDTIYTDPMDEFGTFAIGVGAGSLLIGDVNGVEAILRSAGQSDLPSLARSGVAREVQRRMPSGDLMSWAFWDMQKIYGLMSTNPAFKDGSETGPSLLGLQTGLMPDVELSELAERIGPQWSMGRSTKNGFEFRFGLMDGGK